MPLHPRTVTAATRIMLPTYVVLFALIGLSLLLQKPHRTSGELYNVPKMIAGGSIQPWGAVFLILAGLMVGALLSHRRHLEQWILVACTALVAFWGGIYFFEGLQHETVSFTAGLFVFGWVPSMIATIASLGRNEIS